MKHIFTVEVDIAPALGKDTPVPATDYGYIILPKSYTEDGDATRLIIVCHGASATLDSYRSTKIDEFSQFYWLDMGYAIMDMYACPPALGNGSELHYGNPTVTECYEKGYAYVMEHFNLKTDGVFVVGSSMGGISSFQIVQSGKFPVLAQVGNCPVIDLFKQEYCNPWASADYQRGRIADYFVFEGIKPTFTQKKHTPSAPEVDYFKSNFEKTVPYSPILAAVTSGDVATTLERIPESATVTDPAEAALYEQLTAGHPCPLLIIHNKDDGVVSYRYSTYFASMLERGGADVTLKLYDEGGHAAWDNGPVAPIKDHSGTPIELRESKRLAVAFFKNHER